MNKKLFYIEKIIMIRIIKYMNTYVYEQRNNIKAKKKCNKKF